MTRHVQDGDGLLAGYSEEAGSWRQREEERAHGRGGAVFFVLALTPSLLPRDLLFQGAACGLCAGTGYLLGVWVSWNWRTWIRKVVRVLWEAGGRSLPRWWPRWRRRVEVALSLAVILTLNGILLRAVGWQ